MSPGHEFPGRVARPQGWKPENLQAAEARSRTQVGRGRVRGLRSPTPRHRDRGKAGWGRGRAEPKSQRPGRAGESPPGRGRARAERDTLAATCCWIFPSSVTTQCVVAKAPRAATLSKAERLRNQPGLEHGGSSHRPRTPTAAAILPPPQPGRSHRKRKWTPAVRHLGEVDAGGGGGGGAEGALPADYRLPRPRARFRRRGSAASAAGPIWLQVGDRFLIIVFLCAIRSRSVGTRGREK